MNSERAMVIQMSLGLTMESLKMMETKMAKPRRMETKMMTVRMRGKGTLTPMRMAIANY